MILKLFWENPKQIRKSILNQKLNNKKIKDKESSKIQLMFHSSSFIPARNFMEPMNEYKKNSYL